MRRMLSGAVMAVAMFVSTACSVDKVSAPERDITEVTFASSLNVNLDAMTRSSSGLYTQDLIVGTGDAVTVGSSVTVHYTGWLTNGNQFDSSVGGNPFSTLVGVGAVIRGWDEGLIGMMPGGKRRLIVPASLAYGNRAQRGIPANSILVFDVELLTVQ